MKNISIYIVLFLFGLTACNDSFMEQTPQTELTTPNFFKNIQDLQTYVNGLHQSMMPYPVVVDPVSDNVIYYFSNEEGWNMLGGLLNADVVGGWNDWGNLRSINLMLNNLSGVTGDVTNINHYVGIARYYRALFYINKLQRYSNVPLYEKVLESDDPDIFKASDPRSAVVDFIMADLEYAVTNIKADDASIQDKTLVHRYCALALMSRFCLYEGTFRKYHNELDDLHSETAYKPLLEKSIWASEQIINSRRFEAQGAETNIPSADDIDIASNIDPDINFSRGFRLIFLPGNAGLASNKEIIQWINNRYPDRGNPAVHSDFFSLSRSLQESFLTNEGKPYSTVSGYEKKTYREVFKNRDPRMAETFMHPGFLNENKSTVVTYIDKGGYTQGKFMARPSLGVNSSNGIAIYRYGEVLLNYAEAKAELSGNQAIADISNAINQLRDRVGMPHFNVTNEVDADLRKLYPESTDLICAIRRERRVELACEGFREQDIYRWNLGKHLLVDTPSAQQGMYIDKLGGYELSGGATNDWGILNSESDLPIHSSLPENSGIRGWYFLTGNNVLLSLTDGTKGYIKPKEPITRRFEEPKYYYRPIPIHQLVLNKNLKQPFNW